MSVISNFSVLIFIFLTLAPISNAFNATAVAENNDAAKNNATKDAAKNNATEDTDFTFLVTAGYRPATHTLTKYLVSVRGHPPNKFFGDNHSCGGSIIGPRIILTAAHCVTDYDRGFALSARSVHVVVKTTNRLIKTDETLEIGAEKVRTHTGYDPDSTANDIAIIKLDQDIDMDDRLAAIISLPNGPATPGLHCTLVGWGRILHDGPLAADAIYADMDVQEHDKCRAYPMYQEGMLCAANLDDLELDACNGDSGGPLICDSKVVGLVSYGMGCARGLSGVYTDIGFYLKWIEENPGCRHAGSSFLILFFAIVVIVCQ